MPKDFEKKYQYNDSNRNYRASEYPFQNKCLNKDVVYKVKGTTNNR